MKLTAVSDVFMKGEYYRECAAKFPSLVTLDKVLFFGVDDYAEMRNTAYKIERGGSMTVPPPDGLEKALRDTEILMVHLCPVPEYIIDAAKNLKVILLNRGGTENVDIAAASRRGIAVLSNPAHNANGVAELTVGLMIAETRNIVRAHNAMAGGGWREIFPNSVTGVYELRGKTVGIVGYGNIGRLVAKYLRMFDCNITVYDPNVLADDRELSECGGKMLPLDELMKTADIVTLHARANELILGKEQLSLMKQTAYFINTARPHLVDYDALYELLRDGKILGAALEVHPKEPTDPAYNMLTLDNVTLTNHRGGATVNCYADSPAMLFAEAIKLFDCNEKVKFWCNEKETSRFFGR